MRTTQALTQQLLLAADNIQPIKNPHEAGFLYEALQAIT